MNFSKSNKLTSIAENLIPEQTMTMAKKAANFPLNYPKYIQSASGCELIDVDGNKFIDYSMSLGVYTLGYNHKDVLNAVKKQLANGTLFSLPNKIEIELAKKLVSIIPCAEKARFFKNGADATGIAIRLARSSTKKNHVIQCGYHGHHDWYSHVLREGGTIEEVKSYTHSVNFNDYESIEKIINKTKNKVAAIIIETAFDEPVEGYLEKIRKICSEKNIILIFDEMWTGFRFSLGGAQEYFDVTPDLATFSKGISNGFPISAIVGKKDIMESFKDIWGFTTFGGDTLPMVAALATINSIENDNVINYIWDYGQTLKKSIKEILKKFSINDRLKLIGYDCRFMFEPNSFFNDNKLKIYEMLVSKGVLWNNMFVPSYSHKKKHMNKTIEAFNFALKNIK